MFHPAKDEFLGIYNPRDILHNVCHIRIAREGAMERGAIFSPDRIYRYKLWRIWDSSKPLAMFIGLNPSTADETCDDPTVAKCQRYAREWGFGGLVMTNVFAFRSTDKSVLKEVIDPIGPENDYYLTESAKSTEIVIAAWGNDGVYLGRSHTVRSLLPKLNYLKLNKTGEPAHPLYLSGLLAAKLLSC